MNKISRKQSCYVWEDWLEIKRVLRYLARSMNLGLKFTNGGKELECYVDASLGVSDAYGKSTTDFIVIHCGNPVYRRIEKQSRVACLLWGLNIQKCH